MMARSCTPGGFPMRLRNLHFSRSTGMPGISLTATVYEFLRDMPVNVLALEYRGYGRSEGTPTERGVYRDADAAYLYLVNTKGKDPKTVISFGQSLGSAVAAHLAAHHEVGGVV